MRRARGARGARADGAAVLVGLSLFFCAVTLLPLVALVATALVGAPGEAISHYAATVLPRYMANTLALAGLVGVSVTVLGVASAWLVTMCRFPGRALFAFALVLPLAMPGYVSAYAYTDLLSHPGPVQSGLRALTGWGPQDYWFPQVRSLGGAAFVLSMVLTPYVYLMARTAFLQQSASALDCSRVLGRSPWRAFLGIAVPLARPAIVAGTALAVMETLADYGTVAHFGVETFTTAIYRTWFSMGERVAAVQLSLVLVGFVLLVLAMERVGRRGRRFVEARAARPATPLALSGWRAGAAFAVCATPVALGFLVPAGTLVWRGLSLDVAWLDARTTRLIANTVMVAGIGALCAVTVAVVIAYARRVSGTRLGHVLGELASFGYAVPGAVIAVGLLIPFGAFDRWLNSVAVEAFGVSTGLVLTGTIAALVVAYVVRFLAVSLNGVEAGLARIPPTLDVASRTLGVGRARTFVRVHAPLLSGGLLTAFLITFVDVMKELPATLILRPFDFDTLAIRAHRLASDERLAMAAVPSLMIVAVGLLPVIVLSRQIAVAHRRSGAVAAGPAMQAVATPHDVELAAAEAVMASDGLERARVGRG